MIFLYLFLSIIFLFPRSVFAAPYDSISSSSNCVEATISTSPDNQVMLMIYQSDPVTATNQNGYKCFWAGGTLYIGYDVGNWGASVSDSLSPSDVIKCIYEDGYVKAYRNGDLKTQMSLSNYSSGSYIGSYVDTSTLSETRVCGGSPTPTYTPTPTPIPSPIVLPTGSEAQSYDHAICYQPISVNVFEDYYDNPAVDWNALKYPFSTARTPSESESMAVGNPKTPTYFSSSPVDNDHVSGKYYSSYIMFLNFPSFDLPMGATLIGKKTFFQAKGDDWAYRFYDQPYNGASDLYDSYQGDVTSYQEIQNKIFTSKRSTSWVNMGEFIEMNDNLSSTDVAEIKAKTQIKLALRNFSDNDGTGGNDIFIRNVSRCIFYKDEDPNNAIDISDITDNSSGYVPGNVGRKECVCSWSALGGCGKCVFDYLFVPDNQTVLDIKTRGQTMLETLNTKAPIAYLWYPFSIDWQTRLTEEPDQPPVFHFSIPLPNNRWDFDIDLRPPEAIATFLVYIKGIISIFIYIEMVIIIIDISKSTFTFSS